MCKTIFSQHVCGLTYKAIGYLNNKCSPFNFDDVGKEGQLFGDVGEIVKRGFSAVPDALDSSIKDLKQDYGNAQLNSYFRQGAQGFAQSMCMAAFGYEIPLFSEDFLLDAAYSFPVKTTVVIAPRERELSTYNPAKQTAIFNYNIAGIILPGCRIRNYRVSLKCIGPEDIGHPGIDQTCGGKGCDCLNREGVSTFEGEREKLLISGPGLTSGQMFSIPLESPQRVDSHFRYDHVKVELLLDQSEIGNVDKCFDAGYFDGNKGIFYEPLIDVSPPVALTCQASLVNGVYNCPQLSSQFGFGGASLEEPFVTCWNSQTERWTNCDSPNLFVQSRGDQIKVKVHVNLDDKGKCLKRTVRNVPSIEQEGIPRLLPENNPGLQTVQDILASSITDPMFGGTSNIIRSGPGSNTECGGLAQSLSIPTTVQPGTFKFSWIADGDNFRLNIPLGVTRPAGFSADQSYTLRQINDVSFNLGGFRVQKVLGNVKANDQVKECNWVVSSGRVSASTSNERRFEVIYELFERDEVGSCRFNTPRVKPLAGGRSIATKTIRIQKEETLFQQLRGLDDLFTKGNYDSVFNTANQIINQRNGDLNEVIAIYYQIASLIMKGSLQQYETQITNLLTLFFTRELGGQRSTDYSNNVKNSGEYQKINAYLCEVSRSIPGGPKYHEKEKCQI